MFDVTPGRAEAFCAREGAARHALRLTVAPSAEAACRAAQVIVPVTIAPKPYIPAAWLGEGSLFVSISSLDPMVEVLREADVLVCDDWEHDTGHPARPFARALAEGAVEREQVVSLGELLIGSEPGRTSPVAARVRLAGRVGHRGRRRRAPRLAPRGRGRASARSSNCGARPSGRREACTTISVCLFLLLCQHS